MMSESISPSIHNDWYHPEGTSSSRSAFPSSSARSDRSTTIKAHTTTTQTLFVGRRGHPRTADCSIRSTRATRIDISINQNRSSDATLEAFGRMGSADQSRLPKEAIEPWCLRALVLRPVQNWSDMIGQRACFASTRRVKTRLSWN